REEVVDEDGNVLAPFPQRGNDNGQHLGECVVEGAEVLGLSDLEPHGATVRARNADAFLERIDADDAPLRSQPLASRPRQAPRPTADIEDARALLESNPLDQALASFELGVTHPIVGLREMPGRRYKFEILKVARIRCRRTDGTAVEVVVLE